MKKRIFLFDLDSTITKQEILPTISRKLGIYDKMTALTEMTMNGEIPFKESFLKRVQLLQDIPVSEVNREVEKIQLNEKIVGFLKENRENCFVVTGNLDIWISGLISRIGMDGHVFSSRALVYEDRISNVLSVIDKNAVVNQFTMPFVAIGDGNNDAEMINYAEVGIGYGGVREVAPAVLACATHVIYDEDTLVRFLNQMV